MIKAVLFDLDGTLVNSLADLANSTNYALEKFGFPIHETECFKYFVGDGMPKLIERALPEDKRKEKYIKETLDVFMAHYKEHYCDNTTAYNGISEAVDSILSLGIKAAVVSNKIQNMAETVTNKIFGDRFSIICGKREGYPAKPDPTLTLEVINELGVTPQECLFIGDSGMDMAVAKNANCIALGVLWGFRNEDELIDNGADFIIKEPGEIIKIIVELNK